MYLLHFKATNIVRDLRRTEVKHLESMLKNFTRGLWVLEYSGFFE